MFSSTRSSSVVRWTFSLLLLICCFLVATSYRIDQRPYAAARNRRAVTEWRFRRNFLLPYPYWIPDNFVDEHFMRNDEGEEDFHDNGSTTDAKKAYANLFHDPSKK